jgi:hypothetical protein
MKMNLAGHFFAHLISGMVAVAGFCVTAMCFSVVVMLVWNMVIPDVFGLATISFWQALGLLLLARLLFSGRHWSRRRTGFHMHHNPIREKWAKMTASEQAEFIRNRHAFFHKHSFGRGGFWDECDFGSEADDAPKGEK